MTREACVDCLAPVVTSWPRISFCLCPCSTPREPPTAVRCGFFLWQGSRQLRSRRHRLSRLQKIDRQSFRRNFCQPCSPNTRGGICRKGRFSTLLRQCSGQRKATWHVVPDRAARQGARDIAVDCRQRREAKWRKSMFPFRITPQLNLCFPQLADVEDQASYAD